MIPGNVIVRQRGRKFWPGQNIHEGRDFTLTATEPGYVVFYEHHIPYPHQGASKLQPPQALNMSRPGSVDDGSRPLRELSEPKEFAPVKFPRGVKRYVGIVKNPEDILPRDERVEGRERRFWMTEKGSESATPF